MIKHIPKIPDHKALIMDLDIYNDRGKGYWKLNTSLLKDETYIEGIQSLITELDILYTNIVDKRLLWDLYKINIKQFSIKYSIYIYQKLKNCEIKKLEKEIQQITIVFFLKLKQINDEEMKNI